MLKKTWVSVLEKTTCQYCRDMHGTQLDEDEEFVIVTTRKSDGFRKVYEMEEPPFHDNCKCVAVYTHHPDVVSLKKK